MEDERWILKMEDGPWRYLKITPLENDKNHPSLPINFAFKTKKQQQVTLWWYGFSAFTKRSIWYTTKTNIFLQKWWLEACFSFWNGHFFWGGNSLLFGVYLVCGWTTPIEKHARQIGSFPQVFGVKIKHHWKPPASVFVPHHLPAQVNCHWIWSKSEVPRLAGILKLLGHVLQQVTQDFLPSKRWDVHLDVPSVRCKGRVKKTYDLYMTDD